MVEDGDVGIVPGAPDGGRWVFEFPFVLPVVPVVEGLVVSGYVPGVAGVVPGVVGVTGETGVVGVVGVMGDVGVVGVIGEVGVVGLVGVVGDLGTVVVVPGMFGVVGFCSGVLWAAARPAKPPMIKIAAS